jgi:acyl carrier protein
MSDAAIYERLNGVFHSVFFDDSIAVTAETSGPDIEGWDSIAHVNLMVAVETEFGIQFTTQEQESMTTVGDMARLIEAKLSKG